MRGALRSALERDSERCQPYAHLGWLFAITQGCKKQEAQQVMDVINPYRLLLEREELLGQYSPTVAGYLLTLETLPQWVREALPLGDLCKIARRTVTLPPGIVGVLGNPDVFACWCQVDSHQVEAGLYCIRRAEVAGTVQLLTAWEGNTKVRVRLPNLAAGAGVTLELCHG